MIKKLFMIIILVFFITLVSNAQKGYIRGKIIDAKTGETLIGVTVKVVGTLTGTITDFDGNYSLGLEEGNYSI